MNQSVLDLCASILTLLTGVVEVDGTRMSRDSVQAGARDSLWPVSDSSWPSRDSVYDQFVCRIWLTRIALWSLLVASSYGILITAFERYFAVIYPIWYKVRSNSHILITFTFMHCNFNSLNSAARHNDCVMLFITYVLYER